MDLTARLRAAIEARGISQAKLAADADLPPETLSRILTGATKEPSVFTLAKIAHALGESVGSLLGEKGFDLDGFDQQRIREFIDWMEQKIGATQLPLLDAASRPNATELLLISDRKPSQSPDTAPIPAAFRRRGATRVFRAVGDSMIGAGILDDDYLFVRPVGLPRLAAGKIVVCIVKGKTFVKKLEMSQRRIRLLSANERYAPLEVARENISFVGIVLGRMGTPRS